MARRTAQTGIRANRCAPAKAERFLRSFDQTRAATSSFEDLCNNWGFSAVILANGAWRDRDIGSPGAEKFLGKGLAYQNPFIYWYNHKNEKDYTGPRYETPDEAVVVGGGLASIDVVKVLQLENYERAMKARGIETNMHELEKGIPAACKAHGIKPEDLGVKGCLLIYRRREQDMPLAQPPDNATPEQIAKTEQVRQKMLKLARDRYLFRFQERRLTLGFVEENGHVVGLQVGETKVEGRKAELIPGSETVIPTSLVMSSIGSVPEKIPGVNMKGEYLTFTGEELPRYEGTQHVFGVGNVVTGQGNIRVSLVHSQKVTNHLIENYLGISGDGDLSEIYEAAEKEVGEQTQEIEKTVAGAARPFGRRKSQPSRNAFANCKSGRATRPITTRGSRKSRRPTWSSALPPGGSAEPTIGAAFGRTGRSGFTAAAAAASFPSD